MLGYMTGKPRILELDALRGVAAAAVVLYHLIASYGDEFGHDFSIAGWVRFGAYGVQLFFIISGFVILMTIEHKPRTRDFVIARAGRLYPTYWTAVLTSAAIVACGALPNRTVTCGQTLTNLTMLQFFVKVPDVDGAYWTLAHELVFYALMILASRARLLGRIEAVSVAWMALATSVALLGQNGVIALHARLQTVLLVRFGHLFIAGMIFYRLRKEGPSRGRYVVLALIMLCELIQGSIESCVVVTIILLIFRAAMSTAGKLLAVRPLVFLGSVSYALYAIHGTVGRAALLALRRHGFASGPALCVVMTTLILAAWAITAFIERPALRWVRGRTVSSRLSPASEPRA
jgi:peptidoglycan/LPS O-acetylase OafA/YrhL